MKATEYQQRIRQLEAANRELSRELRGARDCIRQQQTHIGKLVRALQREPKTRRAA